MAAGTKRPTFELAKNRASSRRPPAFATSVLFAAGTLDYFLERLGVTDRTVEKHTLARPSA